MWKCHYRGIGDGQAFHKNGHSKIVMVGHCGHTTITPYFELWKSVILNSLWMRRRHLVALHNLLLFDIPGWKEGSTVEGKRMFCELCISMTNIHTTWNIAEWSSCFRILIQNAELRSLFIYRSSHVPDVSKLVCTGSNMLRGTESLSRCTKTFS